MLKSVSVIINPISGSDFPVLSHLVRALNKNNIEWEIYITKKKTDAQTFTRRAIEKRPDAIVVFGGDGTIMEVGQALAKSTIPMIILPGGTANIMAKELGVPLDLPKSLQIFSKLKPKERQIDMGVCNGKPFFLRVSTGIFADMVKSTTRKRKNTLGPLGYMASALEHLTRQKTSIYEMTLDGKTVELEGVALMVANTANLGLTGVSLAPNIKLGDGLLDVLVIADSDASSVLSVLSGMVRNKKALPIHHFRVKQASIRMDPMQTILQDDEIIETGRLDIHVVPKVLKILL